ncbi:alkaline phosphatase family protein [Acidicapsa ligni]|uniref:alkaline phosphatase family protein n=1 Tax=Acidicapsa ligni TaxID=542300 RepID=UPI0021DFDD78|nr:ectonucleotide pyrophosphatase/phosphodiesterase [Acidicapsa ligni]
MKRSKLLPRWIAASLLLASSFIPANAAPHKQRMVVVISLDGFPAYALDDPRLPIPTLRKLAREGAVATSMQPINPTVTWPNHTAMVTGVNASQHQVLFNGLLTRNPADGSMTVEPWRDKDLLVHAPTVYDVAYKAGLTTAQVDWVAIYGAKTITWQFPEEPDPKGLIEGHLIQAGVVTPAQLANFDDSSPAWQDEIRTDAAVEILKRYKPNLMLFHLLSLDDLNHEYGPMGNASLETMAFLDDRVKEIVTAIQSAGLAQQTTILVVSDHGFRKISHNIYANAILRREGFVKDENGKPIWGTWIVPDGGSAMVYVNDPARRAELIPKLTTLFSGVEGVDRVYQQQEFAGLGLPTREQSDQAPDLLLSAKPGYVFSGGTQGGENDKSEAGTHGYLNSDPQMQSVFFAWGRGIRPGTHLDHISNLDIAPTISALLGLEMKAVTGHPLQEILSDPRP